jgi:hypothetical protein
MKDWNARITETIAFIRAQNTTHHNRRNAIANLLHQLHTENQIAQITSQSMSQGGFPVTLHRDLVKDYRKFRRALILIRVAVLGEAILVATNQVGAIPDASLSTSLDTLLSQAYQAKQQELQAAYQSLKTTPSVFLSANKINIVATTSSGAKRYKFYFSPDDNQYWFRPASERTGIVNIQKTVYHVAVQQYSDVKSKLDKIDGGNAAGCDVLVTTQLTGCTFMYQTDGANLVAAHVQPGGGVDQFALRKKLRDEAAFKNELPGKPVRVFGAVKTPKPDGYCRDKHSYIIGVRNGQWELHAQRHVAVLDRDCIPETWQVAP